MTARHAPPRGPVITARRLWWADTVAVVVLATVATAAALAPSPRVHTAADTLPAPTSPPLRTGVVTLDAGPLVVPSIGAVEESDEADALSAPVSAAEPTRTTRSIPPPQTLSEAHSPIPVPFETSAPPPPAPEPTQTVTAPAATETPLMTTEAPTTTEPATPTGPESSPTVAATSTESQLIVIEP